MEEIELPELTTMQLEILCSTAQDTARECILSKIALENVESLDVCVEAQGSERLDLLLDVDLILST